MVALKAGTKKMEMPRSEQKLWVYKQQAMTSILLSYVCFYLRNEKGNVEN
jgi:hypothetical protein